MTKYCVSVHLQMNLKVQMTKCCVCRHMHASLKIQVTKCCISMQVQVSLKIQVTKCCVCMQVRISLKIQLTSYCIWCTCMRAWRCRWLNAVSVHMCRWTGLWQSRRSWQWPATSPTRVSSPGWTHRSWWPSRRSSSASATTRASTTCWRVCSTRTGPSESEHPQGGVSVGSGLVECCFTSAENGSHHCPS